MKTSFCLITLNEEENLGRCLKSCADLADEIVVVDSGSTDGTQAIAKQFGARWISQPWLGFVGQKNRAIQEARMEWVFSLDADEELSPGLAQEVRHLKQTGAPAEVAAYSMPRCVLYEGRWIRHGDWYPDRLVRWFRKERAHFEGARVHERLVVEGGIAALRNDLYHYSFRDEQDHWQRCQKYARLWAESQAERGRKVGPWAPWTRSVFRWLRGYVLRAGFLDGTQGWKIARMNAREVALKYRLLRELSHRG